MKNPKVIIGCLLIIAAVCFFCTAFVAGLPEPVVKTGMLPSTNTIVFDSTIISKYPTKIVMPFEDDEFNYYLNKFQEAANKENEKYAAASNEHLDINCTYLAALICLCFGLVFILFS